MVESQPSKLLVAGSIPVSRSKELGNSENARCHASAVGKGEASIYKVLEKKRADVAQLVEHSLGKGEVTSSILVIGSMSSAT